VHARLEDAIRSGKDTGLGKFPSNSLALNTAWLAASLTAATLLAWLRHLALDGDLAKAEPKTVRYRILHTAARLVRGGRRRRLKIPATWPWADAITIAWYRFTALWHKHPDQRQTTPAIKEVTVGPVEPTATRPASRGHRQTRTPN
jgi:Transposase DDE domain group 1